jgi:putative alpha-1,2-mannosidase
MKGGMVNIEMRATPNTQRGIQAEDMPYSFSIDEKKSEKK